MSAFSSARNRQAAVTKRRCFVASAGPINHCRQTAFSRLDAFSMPIFTGPEARAGRNGRSAGALAHLHYFCTLPARTARFRLVGIGKPRTVMSSIMLTRNGLTGRSERLEGIGGSLRRLWTSNAPNRAPRSSRPTAHHLAHGAPAATRLPPARAGSFSCPFSDLCTVDAGGEHGGGHLLQLSAGR